MGKINVSQLKPGMVLSGPAKTPNGYTLLPTGTTVIERHIGILKTWGVVHVEVAGDEIPISTATARAPTHQESEQEIRARIESRFAQTVSNPTMQQIMNLAIDTTIAASASGMKK